MIDMSWSRLAFALALVCLAFSLALTGLPVFLDSGKHRIALVVAVVHVAAVTALLSLLWIETRALSAVPPLAWHDATCQILADRANNSPREGGK